MRNLRALAVPAQLAALHTLDADALAHLGEAEIVQLLGEITRAARLATRLAQRCHHAQQAALQALGGKYKDGA